MQLNRATKFATLGLALLISACASTSGGNSEKTVRICTQDGGCSMQPRSTSTVTYEAAADSPELQALKTKAEQDPRAAFDLGLRYYRGDGVERNTYQALRWMREAAEHGHTPAQLALGRFYLSGVEEMGPDPAEAESWLALAAEKGDSEAQKLLVQAQQAKKDEIEYQRWVSNQRLYWLGYWASGYHYYSYWRQGAWYFY